MPLLTMRDGSQLSVRVLGRGSPVMLVHGFASEGKSWLPFITPLLHRHRFILPDLRGFGRSHGLSFPQPCVLTQFARDLHDVLVALDVPSAPVVGISMGALSAAQAFRIGEASRFARYMHVDQGPVIKTSEAYPWGLMGDAQAAFFARVGPLLARLQGEHFHQPWSQLPEPLRLEFWALMGEFAATAFSHAPVRRMLRKAATSDAVMRRFLPTSNWQVYTTVVRAYLEREYDLRDSFRTMRVPLTVLIGGGSRMYAPAGQRAIAQLAPHATVREIPGAGHMIPYEAPRAFVTELRHFLTA